MAMTHRELLELVKEMRSRQRLYFQSRSKTALQRAKALEAQVDAELARLLPDREEDEPQGLFD